MRSILLACVLATFAGGCPDVSVDPNEGPGMLGKDPTVEFDPANSVIPFPNNLVLDPTTGKVNLPKQCGEGPAQAALRTRVLNKLDGFGTYEVGLQVTFTQTVDMATIPGNIVLYQRTMGATENSPATAQTIPIAAMIGMTARFDAACTTPSMVNAVTIIPLVPLQQKSTYIVAVLKGIKTSDGKDFLPSFTWALVRQSTDPVTLDASGNVIKESTPLDPSGDANGNGIPDLTELKGLDLLWKAHAKALAFLDGAGHSDRTSVLLAWEFTTQTTTDPLDPAIAGSPASMLMITPPLATLSVPTQFGVPCNGGGCTNFLANVVGLPCGSLPCAAVGDILGGAFASPNYQTATANPLAGGAMIPGAWDDPSHPTSSGGAQIQFLAFIPRGNAPANGWPLVVFGHGLGSSKESLFAIASQLAAAGFASVSIDFVAHGSRAVLTSKDPALACIGHCSTTTTTGCEKTNECPMSETCVGAPVPTAQPQCFAPIFSTDLATTRDNIRQTILDLQRLVLVMKACGAMPTPASCVAGNQATNPSALTVDPAHIAYAGISLGGIIGTTTTAVTADLKGSVLNVPGVGWGDILENTQTLDIRCLLVDSLIDAGVLTGAKWNKSSTAPTGLCATQDWQTQPGYQQFRAAIRWVLDPADGANFTSKLAPKKFLIQEVVGDRVVPNIATDREAALVGKASGAAADCGVPNGSPPPFMLPSMAITTDPMTSKFVKYPTLPPSSTCPPGNTFEHASLLRPVKRCSTTTTMTCSANTDCPSTETCNGAADGSLATARLQTDAITFLLFNH